MDVSGMQVMEARTSITVQPILGCSHHRQLCVSTCSTLITGSRRTNGPRTPQLANDYTMKPWPSSTPRLPTKSQPLRQLQNRWHRTYTTARLYTHEISVLACQTSCALCCRAFSRISILDAFMLQLHTCSLHLMCCIYSNRSAKQCLSHVHAVITLRITYL